MAKMSRIIAKNIVLDYIIDAIKYYIRDAIKKYSH